MRGSEDYTTLKDGFAPVIDEINDLLEDNNIEVRGNTVQLKFFFCGDYKVKRYSYIHMYLFNGFYPQFMLLFMGLNQAHSNYACLYCTVHKDNRFDM